MTRRKRTTSSAPAPSGLAVRSLTGGVYPIPGQAEQPTVTGEPGGRWAHDPGRHPLSKSEAAAADNSDGLNPREFTYNPGSTT